MSFELACAADQVGVEEAFPVTIGEYDVAVARCEKPDGGSEFFAVQNLCTHAHVELSEGIVEDCTIECWLHGSQFSLRTGEPLQLPATEPVATFPVEVRDDGIYVDTTTTLNGVTPQ
ncbi:non-heme iron oxygenase ferredoxin subunit [Nocardioides sp. GXZ039]|uniref:non-heme iron oxygenase ferredoxin subunit n=1 Tax=Nocardioides sp. GXZ039 TaxID=3136018 RepID=UPI0030F3B1C4